MLATIHAYAFDQRTDARHAWSLRENAAKSAKLLSAIISARLISMGLINPLVGLVQTVANILGGPEGLFKPGPEATQLYGNMLSSGRSHKAIVAEYVGRTCSPRTRFRLY